MLVTRKSMISGIERTLELPITEQDLENYYQFDLLIQHAFPNLSPGEREFIKTGITEEEWDSVFGNLEDEE